MPSHVSLVITNNLTDNSSNEFLCDTHPHTEQTPVTHKDSNQTGTGVETQLFHVLSPKLSDGLIMCNKAVHLCALVCVLGEMAMSLLSRPVKFRVEAKTTDQL